MKIFDIICLIISIGLAVVSITEKDYSEATAWAIVAMWDFKRVMSPEEEDDE